MSLSPIKYIKIILSCVIGTYSFNCLYSANDNYPSGTRFSAMGNIGVTCPDLWSVSHNQAGLGFYNHLSVGFHHENRFAIREFGMNSVALTLPTATGTFGLSYTYFGCPSYHENKVGLGFGKSLNKWFSAGLQFNYLNTYVADETGNLNGMTFEAGIIARPLQNVSIGFHVYNPIGVSFNGLSEKERIPVIVTLGVGYDYDEKLFIGIEALKDLEMPNVLLKAGIEYRLIRFIYIRTGIIISEWINHSFGLGFTMKKIKADIAFSHQQIIGYTPHFSIQYNFR